MPKLPTLFCLTIHSVPLLTMSVACSEPESHPTGKSTGAHLSPKTELHRQPSNNVPGKKVLVGKVVSIADGDTVTVLDDTNTQHKIRLEGIDAPESNQAYGTKSKRALAEKVFQKSVRIRWLKADRYRRILGQLFVDDRWINKEMVAEGWAWHYKQYSSDDDLAGAEVAARKAKLGLWSDPKPVPPWDFRHNPSAVAPAVPATASGDTTVYVTRSGAKYHLGTCRSLRKSKIRISLEEAGKRYSPCRICNPPLVVPASQKSATADPQKVPSTVSERSEFGTQNGAIKFASSLQKRYRQLVPRTPQVTVYVTRTGSKYHSGGCRYLRKSKIPISYSAAQRRYSACSVCGGGGGRATAPATTWDSAAFNDQTKEWTVRGNANRLPVFATVFVGRDSEWHLRGLVMGNATVFTDRKTPSQSAAWDARIKAAATEDQKRKKQALVDEIARQEKRGQSRIRLAKQLIDKGKTAAAKRRLRALIEDFPNTKAASEAEALLKSLMN